MASFFKKYPKTSLVILNLFIFIVMVILIELFLKKYAPFNVATVGHKFCENAKLYGWGYAPHEQLRNFDPDSGKTYFSRTNNHGWRDLDREFDNKKGAFRILVLGDSIAFGGIVPAEKMYTRILEDKLQRQGYNAEVINMSYGGWGTDQEYEALKNEGIKYHPNLVIIDFAINDPGDSAYFFGGSAEKKGWKPFYYEVDDHNVLHKKINPYFYIEPRGLKEKLKNLYSHDSEILKRIWAVYLISRFQNLSSNTGYVVTENKLLELETVFGIQKTNSFYQYLMAQIGKRPKYVELKKAIEKENFPADQEQGILRILEDRVMTNTWTKEWYYPKPEIPNSFEWRLYFALMREMKKLTADNGADLALLPNSEEGDYQEVLYWFAISNDPVSKANYQARTTLAKSRMKEMGIDVIENTLIYKRARNDGHPNIEGNEAMAEDIFKYLMLHKKKELESYRKLDQKLLEIKGAVRE